MSIRDALVARAIAEWQWFGMDEGRHDKYLSPSGGTLTTRKTGNRTNPRKETVEPYAGRVADYWLSVPSKDYDRLVRNFAKVKGRLDGTVDLAWSAAFISYCMQMAGAGSAFPYATGHATWIVKSIKARRDKKLKAGLVGYRPGEVPLEIGDLIGRPRVAGVTYENAVAKGWFESHSDIVVKIDLQRKVAYVIGGNVGQSVSRAAVRIGADGRLNDRGNWIVHIRNNIVAGSRIASRASTPSGARVG